MLVGDLLPILGPYLGVIPSVICVLTGLIFYYYMQTLQGSEGLAGVRERLAHHGEWREAYFAYLRQSLAWVDGKLGASPWGADSYEFTLRMAVIYPFASLLIIWMVTGQNTSGISDLLPENLAVRQRVDAVTAMSLAAVLYYASMKAGGGRQWAYQAGGFVVACAVAVSVGGAAAVAFAIYGALAVAVTVAGGRAFTGAVTLAFSSAFGGAVAVAFGGTIAIAIAGGCAVTVAYAVPYAWKTMSRCGRLGLFFWLYIALMAFTLTTLAHFAQPVKLDNEASKFLLVFLALLPLINSIFDWLSLAVTRWLLRHVAEGKLSGFHVAGKALLSLAAGVLLLAALAIGVTAALQTMNLLSQGNGGHEFFDLAGTLDRVRTNPADPAVAWVYFTLFSTMLPTLAHLVVVAGSFVTWRLPDAWRQHWLSLIDNHDLKQNYPVLVGMAIRLTLLDSAAIVIAAGAFAVMVALCVWLLPQLGWGLLWLCEKVALIMGAPVMLGPSFAV